MSKKYGSVGIARNGVLSGQVIRPRNSSSCEQPFAPSFHDQGGRKLIDPVFSPVFWGKWPDSAMYALGDALETIAHGEYPGTYLWPLRQYLGVRVECYTLGWHHVTTSAGPNVTFTNSDVESMLRQEYYNQLAPWGDWVFCVFMPPGSYYAESTLQEYITGRHGLANMYIRPPGGSGPGNIQTPYLWVLNDSQDNMTTYLSHEVVETITNPYGNGILSTTQDCMGQFCEIADVCESTTGTFKGVAVQSYWSQSDSACVLPSTYECGRAPRSRR